MSNERKACAPADRWRFDKTDSHCSFLLCHSQIFVDLQIQDHLTVQSHLITVGCPLTREHDQKKNQIFNLKSVRVRLRENVRLRECVNTEFD